MSLIMKEGLVKDKTEDTTPRVVNFTLSNTEYTELWLNIRTKVSSDRTFELAEKLLSDHSSILKEITSHHKVKIVWPDGFNQDLIWDEKYGTKDSKK